MNTHFHIFDGKPDPFEPGLTNDQMAAAYFERYGQHPGNPSVPEGKYVPGYFSELRWINDIACQWAFYGGDPNYKVSELENTDCAFANVKANEFYYTNFWMHEAGHDSASAMVVDRPDKPHGEFTERNSLGFVAYYYNVHLNADPPPVDPPPVDPPVDPVPPVIVPVSSNIMNSISSIGSNIDYFSTISTGIMFWSTVRKAKLAVMGAQLQRIKTYLNSINGVVPK